MTKPQRDAPRPTDNDEVTEASIESFPASDPPAFNASTPPKHRPKNEPRTVEQASSAGPRRLEDRDDAAGVERSTRGTGAARPGAANTAELRGNIPSGRTMGVSSAAEPAAAPFDTDDEAAGRPASVAAMRTTLAEEARGTGTTGAASERAARSPSPWLAILLIVVVLALLALWLF